MTTRLVAVPKVGSLDGMSTRDSGFTWNAHTIPAQTIPRARIFGGNVAE
jgi:hypothetical protein